MSCIRRTSFEVRSYIPGEVSLRSIQPVFPMSPASSAPPALRILRGTITGSQGSQNRPPGYQNGSQPIVLRLTWGVLRTLRQDSGILILGSGYSGNRLGLKDGNGHGRVRRRIERRWRRRRRMRLLWWCLLGRVELTLEVWLDLVRCTHNIWYSWI
jgi:hypothetical protein